MTEKERNEFFGYPKDEGFWTENMFEFLSYLLWFIMFPITLYIVLYLKDN